MLKIRILSKNSKIWFEKIQFWWQNSKNLLCSILQNFEFLNKKLTFVTLCIGGEDNLFRFHRNLILWSGQDFGDFSRGSVFLRRHLSISRNYFFRVFNLFFFVVVRNVSLASSIANCS